MKMRNKTKFIILFSIFPIIASLLLLIGIKGGIIKDHWIVVSVSFNISILIWGISVLTIGNKLLKKAVELGE